MKKKEPLVVYWTPFSPPEKQYEMLMTDIHFKSVMRDITKRKSKNPILPPSNNPKIPKGGYHLCTALHNLVDNIYYLPAPFDAKIKVNDLGTVLESPKSTWFSEREPVMQDAFNIDFLFEISVFCEEDLEISVLPPYLHKTSQSEFGYLSSVQFNISRWFRPLVFIYQLWPGVKELTFKKGEPFSYVKFHTDRPIVFKQVKLTKTMYDIANACLEHKFTYSFLPLTRMYEKFTNRGMRSLLIAELKKNVIE